MSSTRINKNTYEIVKPSRSLLFFSAPCEQRAAGIVNSATESMRENEPAEVAYRFLQSRQGAKNSLIEACGWSIGLAAMITMYRMSYRVPAKIALPLLVPIAAHIPPNVGNYMRYKKLEHRTKDWLIENIKEEKFNEIEAMEFNKGGVQNLIKFFQHENVDTTLIELKANKTTDTIPWWKCR